MLKIDEGCRLDCYLDTEGIPTIGYGHTGHLASLPQITQEQANNTLEADANKAILESINILPGRAYDKLNKYQRSALANMCYQLGANGVSKFVNTIYHLNRQEFTLAAFNAIDSKWYEQTPNRCLRVTYTLCTGQLHKDYLKKA
ncbi:MAG: glycoside hydrolase family protein [Alphaproteobacteria bacterium]